MNVPTNVLTRLDERDRALFVRWSIVDALAPARAFWIALTHLGGVSCSVAAALTPIGIDGPVGAGGASRACRRSSCRT